MRIIKSDRPFLIVGALWGFFVSVSAIFTSQSRAQEPSPSVVLIEFGPGAGEDLAMDAAEQVSDEGCPVEIRTVASLRRTRVTVNDVSQRFEDFGSAVSWALANCSPLGRERMNGHFVSVRFGADVSEFGVHQALLQISRANCPVLATRMSVGELISVGVDGKSGLYRNGDTLGAAAFGIRHCAALQGPS